VPPLVQLARSRPAWLTALWGVCLLLSVLLGSKQAHATEAPASRSEAFSSALAALSASMSATVAATFGEGNASQVEEAPPPPPVQPPPWMAGFCDARGASGIAPLPALPVQGGEVGADEGPCNETTLRAGRTVERNETPGHPATADAVDPAALPFALPFPVRASPRVLPRNQGRLLALPRGFARGLDEPPRAALTGALASSPGDPPETFPPAQAATADTTPQGPGRTLEPHRRGAPGAALLHRLSARIDSVKT